jgi:DNA repair photolyase
MEVLARELYPGSVSVLTKSPLVLRDIDLFRELPDFEAGLTVTSGEDEISRWLEVHAPPPMRGTRRLIVARDEGNAVVRTHGQRERPGGEPQHER